MLLVLGPGGAEYFAAHDIPVVAARDYYQPGLPEGCPLGAANVPLDDVTASVAWA